MIYELDVGGKKYPLEMTVEAYLDICELCPEGNFSRLRDINDFPQRERIEISAKMLEALSRGAENSRAVREPGYQPSPITATQVLALPLEEFFKIYSGMFEIIGKASGKPTVETAQKKTERKKAEESS